MSLRLRRRKDGSVTNEAPLPNRHHFPPRFIDRGVADGYVTFGQGRIVLHLEGGDVSYQIVRPPGVYCVNCGERVGDGPDQNPERVAARQEYLDACSQGPDHGSCEAANYWLAEREGSS